jgi:imidazolonepropionase-like amidohydrolase
MMTRRVRESGRARRDRRGSRSLFLLLCALLTATATPKPALALLDADSLIAPLLPRLAAAGKQVTAFRDVNVIPMNSAEVLRHQTVVISSAQIVRIGPAGTTVIPPNATVIEGSGRYLMPGLMDMHFHMPEPDLDWGELQIYLAYFVANGITTVRSTIGAPSHPLVKQRVERGEILGPSLYIASPPISARDTPTGDEARRKILGYRSDGFDCVKIYEISDTTYLNSVVKGAKEAWLPVIGHVGRGIAMNRALRSMRSIEHLGGYLTSEGKPESTLWSDAAATRDANVWNCPTQFLYEVNGGRDLARLDRAEGMAYMPAATRAQWVAKKRAEIAEGAASARRDSIELAGRREVIGALDEVGAGLLLGSDSPGRFRVPGFALMEEMRAFRAAGLTPAAILTAGTRSAAASMDMQNEVGTVEVGKRADLVLLDANPLENIENVRRRSGVMLRGAWYTREELDGIAGKLADLLQPSP